MPVTSCTSERKTFTLTRRAESSVRDGWGMGRNVILKRAFNKTHRKEISGSSKPVIELHNKDTVVTELLHRNEISFLCYHVFSRHQSKSKSVLMQFYSEIKQTFKRV